jgi:hypothetical protein
MIELILALALAAPVQEVHHPSQGEQLASVLKLDGKTQVPVVQQLLDAGDKEAAPVRAQMLQLREQMLNALITGRVADIAALSDKYAAAAASMATVESAIFAKIYAQLKPAQQAKAAQAFVILGGIYMPAMHTITAAPSRGGFGGGGAGGARAGSAGGN